MSTMYSILSIIAILYVVSSFSDAYDPDPLQDFCVGANNTNGVVVNGMTCKDPATVTSDDFYFPGFNKPRPITGYAGINIFRLNELMFPGINTWGISLVRIDYAPGGVHGPHVHPRASEILTVLQGTLLVGWISSNLPDPNAPNKLYSKVLNAGDAWANPKGLIHFEQNNGTTNAVALMSQSSQRPGAVPIARAIFGAEPPVPADHLAKSFQLDINSVKRLQSLLWSN